MQRQLRAIIISCFLILFTNSQAQGWEKQLVFDSLGSSQVVQLPDEGFLVASRNIHATGNMPVAFRLVKYDQDGKKLWSNEFPVPVSNFDGAVSMVRTSDDRVLLLSSSISDTSSNRTLFLTKLDFDGNWIWSKEYGLLEDESAVKVHTLSDGTIYLFGRLVNANDQQFPIAYKLDQAGDLIWRKEVPLFTGIDREVLYDISRIDSTGFYLSSIGSAAQQVRIAKMDLDGDFDWIYQDSIPFGFGAQIGLATFKDGAAFLAFSVTHTLSNGSSRVREAVKIDGSGNEIWRTLLDSTLYYTGSGFFSTRATGTYDGGAVIAGTYSNTPNNVNDPTINQTILVKLDNNGAIVWDKTADYSPDIRQNYSVQETQDKGLILTGFLDDLRPLNDHLLTNLLIKTDSLGNVRTNLIEGNVYNDLNLDCTRQMTEDGLNGWIVSASNGSHVFYSISDSSGHYEMLVDQDDYEVEIHLPSTSYWSPCLFLDSIYFTAPFEKDTLDFPMNALIDCPELFVDVSNVWLRRCADNRYNVRYCNLGTVAADSAYVELELAPELSITTADLPYVDLGNNLYRFELGNIGVGACADFDLALFVDCDSTLFGQTLCVDAHIYPDTFCVMPSNWSGASIAVEGICQGDTSVVFTIENVGTAPTVNTINYLVIEDHVIMRQGQTNILNPTQTFELPFPANGSTFRLEAMQEMGHPGLSMPSVTIEGCGGLRPGFVNWYRQDNGNLFQDIVCREVRASYDPNDKTGYPLGYDEEHFIKANTAIDYHINFQNTGNDTAFFVALRDTLSPFLDPTTFLPGASSHPYTYELTGNGILKFTFSPIELPDSTTNLVASQGFVKFKIQQQADNPVGTVINNRVGIYFDSNPVVLTNTTTHTIGEDFVAILTSTEEQKTKNEPSSVKVFPNPMGASATFVFEKAARAERRMEVFDALGRLVQTHVIKGDRFTMHRAGLSRGIYLFQIYEANEVLGRGKLMVGE